MEEKQAVNKIAQIVSMHFNTAVIFIPGDNVANGYPASWNVQAKAYVKGVFAAWCIPVVDSEGYDANIEWFQGRRDSRIILETQKNADTITNTILGCQRIANLFRKQHYREDVQHSANAPQIVIDQAYAHYHASYNTLYDHCLLYTSPSPRD